MGTTGERYVEANGIDFYVAEYGTGSPLVLLHGGLGHGEMFTPIIPTLAARHRVITIDLQGHGRTADVDRPFDLDTMADDIVAVIDGLGLDRPDVLGYSLGGGLGLRAALRHPDKIGRLVAASAYIRSDAPYAEILAQQGQVNAAAAEFMKDTPMYLEYEKVAPRPQDFPRLLDKIGAAMAQPYDLTEQIRAGLRVPTLIVAGDADMAPPAHFVEVFALLDGGQRDGGWMGEGRPAGGHALAILPGVTHYTMAVSPLLAAVTLDFLAK